MLAKTNGPTASCFGNQSGKRITRKELIPLTFTSNVTRLLARRVNLLKRSVGDCDSRLDSAADSTITKSSKELEAMRGDFAQTLAQVKQVQTTLRQENNDHAQRAEVLVTEIDEMRLIEMKKERRIHDLIRHRETLTDSRLAEMT